MAYLHKMVNNGNAAQSLPYPDALAGPNSGHPTFSSRIQHHANLLHLYQTSLGHRH